MHNLKIHHHTLLYSTYLQTIYFVSLVFKLKQVYSEMIQLFNVIVKI